MYGAAVASHFDKSWALKNAEYMLLYARDYINPSSSDSSFPPFRMLDWFASHSWAGGISLGGSAAYYNGRNQESSSESIHSYYAAALYGMSMKDVPGYEEKGRDLEEAGRVALAMELRATDKYWHVMQADFYDEAKQEPNVYDAIYREKSVVGILWSGLVQFQTWFGIDPYFVHGIQQIPCTPISEAMLPKKWVVEEYPKFEASCVSNACSESGWKTVVVLEQAIVDKELAWSNALLLPDKFFSNDDAGGNGNSRTNSLHFIATRE